MLSRINSVAKRSVASISYDGLKKGVDYIRFIQSCHIGLSTQNPSAAFNDTSFPSKILSYMANGLAVVTIDIPVIRRSSIGKYINYYEEQTPENIAEAVVATKFENVREIVKRLEAQFIKALYNVID